MAAGTDEQIPDALEALFAPRSIAVVGASDDAMSPAGNLIRNLQAFDYTGDIWPVSARRDSVVGLATSASVADLPGAVDLAVLAIPAEGVPAMLRTFAEHGARGALVLSSGFSESGNPELQQELADVVADTDIRVVGPNCSGYLNTAGGVSANFVRWSPVVPMPRPGPVAVVSQSGGFGNLIVRRAPLEGIGCNWFISTGNEVDVCVSTAIDHVVGRPEVEVVLAFAEKISSGERFVAAAQRAAELDKPIVLLKGGRSEASARAALSHTASLAGSAEALDAVCRQYGVHVADNVDDLIDLARMFATPRRVRGRGRGVGILSASGGVGVVLADAAGEAGLEVPELTADDRARMGKVLPENFLGSLTNPVDLSTQPPVVANPYESVLGCMAESPVIDLLLPVIFHYSEMMVDAARTTFATTDLPMAVLSTSLFPGDDPTDPPVYTDPRRAARALAAVARQSERVAPSASSTGDRPEWAADVDAVIDANRSRPFVLESDALGAFSRMGIPVARAVAIVTTPEEAGAAFARARRSRPVAVKVMSYDIAHKTEVGAVRIGLSSEAEVVDACHEMLEGVTRAASRRGGRRTCSSRRWPRPGSSSPADCTATTRSVRWSSSVWAA